MATFYGVEIVATLPKLSYLYNRKYLSNLDFKLNTFLHTKVHTICKIHIGKALLIGVFNFEHQTHNPKVTGSSPVPATSKKKSLHRNVMAFFITQILLKK